MLFYFLLILRFLIVSMVTAKNDSTKNIPMTAIVGNSGVTGVGFVFWIGVCVGA
jgi:hypothetical protein